MKNFTRIIVTRTEPMSDDQITRALQVSEQTEWWRALVQLIDQFRAEYPESAAACAGSNNPLAMARDVGAHEALTQLLLQIEKRRAG